MTHRKQRNGAFKTRVVVEAFEGHKAVNEIASAYEIHPSQVGKWKSQALARLPEVLSDVLRGQTPDGIRREIIARMIALNVVRILMLEAATAAGVQDPLRISVVHAVRAILSFSSALGHAPPAAVPGIYHAMLTEIASHLNPDRPGRLEPRAVRRDHKHYPSLHITRALWKARHHAA